MRNPNGYGTIKKLSGKRRRPYAVSVTTGFEMVDGKARQIQKNIGYYATRQEAMIALAEYNKNPFDIDKRNTTFKQVYDILFEQKISKMKKQAKSSYVASYKKCAELENMRMIEMRKAHMQKIVDDHADKSKSTQSNIVSLFNIIYKFCLENDIVEKNYAEFVTITSEKESREKIPFSREEIDTLWENIDWKYTPEVVRKKNPMYGEPFIDSILIMIYTGCRIGELLTIKTEDVHLEERWIDLKGTKTKAARRIVPIHKKIIPLIEKRMAGEYLFENNGEPIKYNPYTRFFFDPMCETFRMKHTIHECRHSFATYAAASSMNKTLLKKIIGHASQDITEDVYTHAFVDDLIREIDKLDI